MPLKDPVTSPAVGVHHNFIMMKKHVTDDVYIGDAVIKHLDKKSTKLGAFTKLDATELMTVFENELAKLFEVPLEEDENTKVDIFVQFKLLPMKPENVTDKATHSLKMSFELILTNDEE